MTPPRRMDAALRLLDRQLVDPDGRLTGKVDDLELSEGEDGTLFVSAILSGPGALSRRIGGRIGAWLESVHTRLQDAGNSGPARVSFGVVKDIRADVELSLPREDLPTFRAERWARDHIVAHIPGADRAAE